MVRWHRRRPDLPDDWEDQVAAIDRSWWDRPVEERTRSRDLMETLLGDLRWEAARGFEITEQVKLVIASQAVRPLLGLQELRYPNVRYVIVHASTMVASGPRPSSVATGVYSDDDVALAGEAAHGRGPVVLVWDEVVWDLRHPRRGRNVVVHEFAHKLDMEDDVVDGTPILVDPSLRTRWVEVCTKVFGELEDHASPVLDDYGATDPGEFFAVSTEAFFTRPAELAEHHPDLYEVLSAYYRQDPAGAASS